MVGKVLPSQCDICKDKIAMYRPYYTVRYDGHFTKEREGETLVLCPSCFHSYKDYISSQEEFFIYSRAKDVS